MASGAGGVRVGIDTGGTFTDLVAFDAQTGHLSTSKTPSVPSEPGRALTDAIDAAALVPRDIGSLVHGTTVGTNALIERTGARVLLLTTEGHEDIPYIQRINRKSLYDLRWEKPKPLLISRRDSLGAPERLDAAGNVVRALDVEAVRKLCREARQRPIEAIAISLLFSYVNPEHEQQVRQIVAEELPGLPVSVSHEVAPIWREYERTSTTLADAYLKPLMGRYVRSLDNRLAEAGLAVPWAVMKSNGGAMRAAAAADSPIQTAQSGPAGGMLVAQALGVQAGQPNLLTLDMGGTSADVGMILDGQLRHTTEYEIEWGVPAAIPLIDIKSIGAGGGSIAWIDAGGFLRVGPESARARPGPACYGLGGTRPTVTDANLLLGRLDPGYFLGGRMALRRDLAETALASLAEQAGMPIIDLASAIVEIANENMASAIKMVSLERGYDPRRFALFAFGGAGPLHAAAVARALRIPQVLIPMFPGNASALGMLLADLRVDKVWTKAFRSSRVDAELVAQQFAAIRDAAESELRSEGFAGEPEVSYAISMRYAGQNYEHQTPVLAGEIDEAALQAAFAAFEQIHAERYGYAIAGEEIELVAFHVTVSGQRDKPQLRATLGKAVDPDPPSRLVHFRGLGDLKAAVYRRYDLPAGAKLNGPCLIEEPGSTTLVEPGMVATVLPDGQLLIDTGTRYERGDA
ncbi:MAG: hydantoinase/oxoprolinase family protein [Thermomicrobiales bacterium]|nr:hydantoinase/oxoprolinase family protein [Thermomicrobiales bacterium]